MKFTNQIKYNFINNNANNNAKFLEDSS